MAVVVWHGAALVGLVRRALPGRFGHLIAWYVCAAGALAVGGTLGGLLAGHVGHGAVHERLHAAHAQVNLLGWVGLTVLGTLFTLWPTVLRTRMPERTRRASLVGLRLAVPGLVLLVGGLAADVRPVAAAGLVVYAGGALAALVPLAGAVRARRPHTGAGWMLGAGVVWFEVALAVDVVVVATRPAGEVAAGLEGLLPLVVAGFVGQVLLGSLLHLLPAVLGGGPVRFKENAALLERGWVVRLAVFNAGVVVLALPVPGPVVLLGWVLVLAPVAVFVVLAALALARSASAGRVRPGGGQEGVGARGGAGGRSVVSPALAGVVAGCLLTAAAVVVAVTEWRPAARWWRPARRRSR
ncbi:hypothetical protein [Planomonospora algeriensis]